MRARHKATFLKFLTYYFTMQKSDIIDWLGISGLNIGFLYVNFTHLLEVAQLANIFLSSIATLASAYFTCVKISKHYSEKYNKK